MKRTQLYLDEEMARMLQTVSRQRGKTISELVRASVREVYAPEKSLDKVSLARELSGIWSHRKRPKDIQEAIRKLRAGSRLTRFDLV
jgi:hypothetical protein